MRQKNSADLDEMMGKMAMGGLSGAVIGFTLGSSLNFIMDRSKKPAFWQHVRFPYRFSFIASCVLACGLIGAERNVLQHESSQRKKPEYEGLVLD